MDLTFLLNETIHHKFYAKGTIQNINGNVLEVYFVESDKICKFSYPSCFHKFITLDNADKKKIVDLDVKIWLNESGTLESEQIKQQTLRTQNGIKKREQERQRIRLEKAREEANRLRKYSSQ